MFDKYFCKRLHAKKITLEMVMGYIMNTRLFQMCFWALAIFDLIGVTFVYFLVGFDKWCAEWFPVAGIALWMAIIATKIAQRVAPKIQIASCPLTKIGGNNNV